MQQRGPQWLARRVWQRTSGIPRSAALKVDKIAGVKGVAKNFREIFSELVPGGKGDLVMQRRAPIPVAEDPEDGADEEGLEQQNASEKYSGVKVKVGTLFCETLIRNQFPVAERIRRNGNELQHT